MVIPSVLLGGMLAFSSSLVSGGLGGAALPEVNLVAPVPLVAEVSDRTTVESQNLPDLAERLHMAHITNPQDARDFLERMRVAAINVDPLALADLVHYPFVTYDRGEPVKSYATPEDLLLDFEQIFTVRVINAMRNGKYEGIFVNSQGAMIDHGTIWFFQYSEGIKIKAINNWDR